LSLWPLERIETLTPGKPVRAELLNRMQDGTIQLALLQNNIGLPTILTNRVNVSGTWSTNNVGSVFESANAVTTRVFFTVPVGARLLSVSVLGRQESAASAQFTARLIETQSVATVTALSTVGTSDGVTTGADQTIVSTVTNGYVTILGRRYAVELATTGGSATQRTFISATVFHSRL
jgi:hypothetical protein